VQTSRREAASGAKRGKERERERERDPKERTSLAPARGTEGDLPFSEGRRTPGDELEEREGEMKIEKDGGSRRGKVPRPPPLELLPC
jgi:hypothetical protein